MNGALQEAQAARAAQTARTAQPPVEPPAAVPVLDPLPLCIYATVGLLSWVFSPALTAAVFALIGLRAYARAWGAGLRSTNCLLRDPRLVMVYLGAVATCGFTWTAWRLARWLMR